MKNKISRCILFIRLHLLKIGQNITSIAYIFLLKHFLYISLIIYNFGKSNYCLIRIL